VIRRSFPPGSEWLFVKLYAGVATADQMLRETVAPVVREAVDRGLTDRWFFVRYVDPQPHLRVRFHGAPDALLGSVWPLLQAAAAPLLDDGRIRRLTIDTYEREVERYGGPAGIELAEQVFHADSDAVLEIVELLDPGDLGLEERWRLALHGLHLLLKDLGFDLCTQSSIVGEARTAFGQELRADRALNHQVGEQFRKERASLSQLLEPADGSDNPLGPGLEVLRQRSSDCDPSGRARPPRGGRAAVRAAH
jgi:thiopeptide-type bacteriocin biosynthesis protein